MGRCVWGLWPLWGGVCGGGQCGEGCVGLVSVGRVVYDGRSGEVNTAPVTGTQTLAGVQPRAWHRWHWPTLTLAQPTPGPP